MKAHLKRRYLEDEKKVLGILAMEGSGAGRVHIELGLTRSLIKATMKSLAFSRKLQVTFANISCGTFFKCYNKDSVRLNVQCPICPEICTLSHLRCHLSVQLPHSGDEEELVEYLARLVKSADPKLRLLPIPIQSPE